MDAGVGLADFIADLRYELRRAELIGKGARPQFTVGSVELELQIATEREDGVRGGLKFWVVDVGGTTKSSDNAVQRLKIVLTPTVDGGPLIVQDDLPDRPD